MRLPRRNPAAPERAPIPWLVPLTALGVLLVLGIEVVRGVDAVDRAAERSTELGRLVGEVRHLDEVLTMSALMGAATGEERWRERYRTHEPALARAIERTRRFERAEPGLRLVDRANRELVALEEEAFARVGRDDRQGAMALLRGEPYRREKARYSHGLYLATAALDGEAWELLSDVRNGLILEALIAGVLLLGGLLVLRSAIASQRRSAVELSRAREEARASVQAKDQLVSNVSHEMRTPLNGILGSAELLRSTELSGEQRELQAALQECGSRLVELVDDLLGFAEVETGRVELEKCDLDLRRIVHGVQDLHAPRARKKGVDLVATVAPEVPRVLCGDPLRYRQVLAQLVSNAVEYTDRGEVAVSIEVDRMRAGEVHLRTLVRDTGAGIADDEQHLLFESFRQGDGSTTRRRGGVGLGLALACRLADLMGGGIEVHSTPGKGSTFTFTCRMATPDHAEPEPDSLGGLRALVVDDGSANMRSVWELCLSWGVRTEAVSDLEGALAALDGRPRPGGAFRFVLLDLAVDPAELRRLVEHPAGLDVVGFLEPEAIPPTSHPRLTCLERPVHRSELHDRLREGSRADLAVPGRRDRPSGDGAHVLVVEDNPVNQRIAQRFLQRLGCRVDVADHGGTALERLEDTAYELVLMDCQMPVLDGYDTTRELRRREGSERHTPVVALTANALAGDREKCLAAGMDDFVTKPIQGEVLAQVVERWVPTAERNAGGD